MDQHLRRNIAQSRAHFDLWCNKLGKVLDGYTSESSLRIEELNSIILFNIYYRIIKLYFNLIRKIKGRF
jgi:hypothetical protein